MCLKNGTFRPENGLNPRQVVRVISRIFCAVIPSEAIVHQHSDGKLNYTQDILLSALPQVVCKRQTRFYLSISLSVYPKLVRCAVFCQHNKRRLVVVSRPSTNLIIRQQSTTSYSKIVCCFSVKKSHLHSEDLLTFLLKWRAEIILQ